MSAHIPSGAIPEGLPHPAERAVRNTLANASALGMQFFASLTASALIARRLGPSEMGHYSYLVWLAALLPALVSFGIPNAICKYVAQDLGRHEVEQAARITRRLIRIQVGLAASVSLVAAVGLLSTADPRERLAWAVTLLMLVPQALRESLAAAIMGSQRFDQLARVSFYSALAQLGFVTTAFVLGAGRTGMLLATLAALLAGTLLAARVVRLLLPSPNSMVAPKNRPLRELLGFTLSDSLILLVIWQRPEVFFLDRFSTGREVAFFSIAFALVHRLNELAYAATSVLLPMFSLEFSRSGLEKVPAMARQSFRYTQMLIVPVCALGIAAAGPLITFVYGHEYQAAVAPLQVLLAGAAVGNLSGSAFAMLYALGKQVVPAKLLGPLALLNLWLAYRVVPISGAMGAAWVKSGIYALAALAAMVVLSRHVPACVPWGSLFRIYVAGAAAAGPAAYLAWQGASLAKVLPALALGMPLYLGLLAIWGELGRAEWSLARTILRHPTALPTPTIPRLESFPGSPLE